MDVQTMTSAIDCRELKLCCTRKQQTGIEPVEFIIRVTRCWWKSSPNFEAIAQKVAKEALKQKMIFSQ